MDIIAFIVGLFVGSFLGGCTVYIFLCTEDENSVELTYEEEWNECNGNCGECDRH